MDDRERRAAGNLRDHYELMYACTVVSLSLPALLVIFAQPALPAALPVLSLWATAPWFAWFLSQPKKKRIA